LRGGASRSKSDSRAPRGSSSKSGGGPKSRAEYSFARSSKLLTRGGMSDRADDYDDKKRSSHNADIHDAWT